MTVEDVFLAAVEMAPAERAAYVDAACRQDTTLRAQVRALLRSHEEAGSLLEQPLFQPAPTVDLPSDRPGAVVGPYKLLEQIGEGGFGFVFMAEQSRPVRRKVALKVLKPGMDTRQVTARFEAERQALALMDHPNIAKVFDGGATPAGRPFFVMELVRGVPITEFCDQNQLTPRQRLELFIPVCHAVQHAHQKGIIHRDLKPSNVLVTVHDTTPVPKVIDFGVAKALGQELTDNTLFTAFAQVVGTPLYMSPEQAGQSGLDVDTRSDIYSLGVLLYELLTGTTPFDKDRFKRAPFDEIRRIIREEEPPKPSTRLSELGGAETDARSSAPTSSLAAVAALRHTEPARLTKLMRGELDWIVMKALEKDRNRRYETATGFAADVGRYLTDEPVQACPPTAGYRFRKFARRNRMALATASVIGVAVAVAVAVLAVSTVLIVREQRATDNALQAEKRAKDDLRRDSYFHHISLAHRDLTTDNLGRALKLLAACPEDLRQWEWHYLMRLGKVEPLVLRDKSGVQGVAFSPDGDRLASAGDDGTVKIWNSRTGEIIQQFPAHTGAIVSVAFHPDGKHLASRGVDRTVKVWDLTATVQPVLTEPCGAVRKFGTAYTVAFSPDGRQLAAATDGVVKIWDWENRQLLHRLPGHYFHSSPVAFSRDGRLATGAFRENLKLWNPETGTLLRTVDAHRGDPVSALAFSPDGEWLASASFDRTVKLSNSRTGEVLHSFAVHTGNVECVAFSRDGLRMASGGEDKTVRVWDTTTGREVLGLRGHTDRCGCVAFSPDGRRLASASSDGTIRFWDATPLRGDEGQGTLTFTQHSHEIRSVAFGPDGPDGRRIASAGSDGLVKVWDAQTGEVSAEYSGHKEFSGRRGVIFCVAWHPKGGLIASAGLDTVKVWDARTGREVFWLPAPSGLTGAAYCAVAFSPDGRHMVTGSIDNGVVQVWDAGTGREVGPLDAHGSAIRGVVFSRDGEHLALASSDGTVKLWDAKQLDNQRPDGKKAARLTLRARVAGPGLNVAFSPDGRRLATGGEENTVKIRDVQNGRELQTLRGHNGEVYTVAFSPDGRWIASGGEDSTVKVWDSRTGKLVYSFRGHTSIVSSVAFSTDGKRLSSGSRDNTVKVWDLSKLGEVPNR